MPLISYLKYIFIIILFTACQSKIDNININNKHLSLVNNVILYKEKPYSGILVSKTDTLVIYKASYVNGKKNGKEEKFFFNGKLSESTLYNQGKKTGIHKAWWNNGQLMFEYHFDNVGNYVGTQREWFSNGKLSKETNYTQGQENGSQKVWDYNGKLTANYQVINGERFGLISSKNCKPDNYVD